MTGQQEERLDRRAHWVQIAITGIVIATAWCVKLEVTTATLKTDMEIQKARRDEMIARIIEKANLDHDRGLITANNVEWLIRLREEEKRTPKSGGPG